MIVIWKGKLKMGLLWRLTLLTMVCGLGSLWAGCAVRGSSFQTIGVPTPESRSGQSPVIIGWAREERDGWIVKRVRVDGETRDEWNDETQQPTIIYLEPGEHEFRVNSAQLSEPSDPSSRTRRREFVLPLLRLYWFTY